ncbi:MAG: substrate-binding domain-containing protein, partial [Mediterranea sp.]|jgi:LacI family transcriptional regulator|nr:substrate-binding domain-containing protein [Mediterranea sp.]
VNNLINKGVDGLIIVPCEHSEQSIASLVENRVPVVLFDRYFPSIPTSYVVLDNYGATYSATKWLLDSGCQAPSIVAYNIHLNHMEERVRGYKEAMADNGKAEYTQVLYIDQANPKESADVLIPRSIKKGCDAFIFTTNIISLTGLYALKKMNPKTTSRLKLVGFDGTPAFDFFSTPLSYIQQPVDLFVRKALQIVVDNVSLEHRDNLQQITLEGEFKQSLP